MSGPLYIASGPLRLYLETTAYSPDPDRPDPDRRATWAAGLAYDIRRGHHRPLVSDLVRREVRRAPDGARQLFGSVNRHSPVGEAPIGPAARALATAYQNRGVLPRRASAARLHVALAVASGADVLVTTSPALLAAEPAFREAATEAGHRPVPFLRPREVARRRRWIAEALSGEPQAWSEKALHVVMMGFVTLNFAASRPGLSGRVRHWAVLGAMAALLALAAVGLVTVVGWVL